MFDNHRCHNGLHAIRGPHDLRSNGRCAMCLRSNEARYRAALRDARRQMAELAAAL